MAAADTAGSLGPASVAAQASEGSAPLHQAGAQCSNSTNADLGAEPVDVEPVDVEPVSRSELNAWRRGFTPQAEIWNGRLAMLGLSVGLTVLLIARLAAR